MKAEGVLSELASWWGNAMSAEISEARNEMKCYVVSILSENVSMASMSIIERQHVL